MSNIIIMMKTRKEKTKWKWKNIYIFSVTKHTLKVCNTKSFSFLLSIFLVYFKIKNRKQVHLLKIKNRFSSKIQQDYDYSS